MNFSEQLNLFMDVLECTAKELCDASGLSPATLSRYRSGERIPKIDSDAFNSLCAGISAIVAKNGIQSKSYTSEAVETAFLQCVDVIAADNECFRQKLNRLISELNINMSKLCRYTNYETSALFRIRKGTRHPSNPLQFAADIAVYLTREITDETDKEKLIRMIGSTETEAVDESRLFKRICDWLTTDQVPNNDDATKFLEKLNDFDLNDYIRSIHFDEMHVPSVPFQLPTSKNYTGLKEMMTAELDFLKATVLSKSTKSVIMYSDMPIEAMSKDPTFPKKWLFGMAMMLKKGLDLSIIHNLNRPIYEMLLGLEAYIPLYMTGQVTSYYFKQPQSGPFMHLLNVSGSAAIAGEAVAGHHKDGRYRVTKSKEEVAYYRKQAKYLLNHAVPVMDIYREEQQEAFYDFLRKNYYTAGKKRAILSAPPVYTIDQTVLIAMLDRAKISAEEKEKILTYVDTLKINVEDLLETEIIEDEIPIITREEFEKYPIVLSLSGLFFEKDIPYTFEDYENHLASTEAFSESHANYQLKKTISCTFRNLQIHIYEGKWAMVSKAKSPAIHFVIRHPKLCAAIEHFVPPIVE